MQNADDNKLNVACVIVSFNRLDKLKACIQAIKNQSLGVNEIIVVDQSTEKEVLQWINTQDALKVIKQENQGGAGGFYTGLDYSYKKGYRWIWFLDDDTLPEKMCLEKLLGVINKTGNDKIGFLASKVIWVDGSPHNMNLPGYFYKNRKWEFIGDNKFADGVHKIDCASFVSILISQEAVDEVGFPNKDFFVWYDDLEYTVRMKSFDNYYVAESVVIHDTPSNSSSMSSNFDKKDFIGIRNFCYFYRLHNKSYLMKVLVRQTQNVVYKLVFRKITFRQVISFYRAAYLGLTGNLKKQVS